EVSGDGDVACHSPREHTRSGCVVSERRVADVPRTVRWAEDHQIGLPIAVHVVTLGGKVPWGRERRTRVARDAEGRAVEHAYDGTAFVFERRVNPRVR